MLMLPIYYAQFAQRFCRQDIDIESYLPPTTRYLWFVKSSLKDAGPSFYENRLNGFTLAKLSVLGDV